MSIKNTRNQLLFLIITILISLKSITYQIQVPLKQIKTTFQKVITKKVTPTDDSSPQSISSHINNLDNYLFATEMLIGSNDQKFTILLDTGSEILWVPGQGSSSTRYKKYNPSDSQTSSKTSDKLEYEYSSGKITGYYYYDQIDFLSSSKYRAYFGVASNINIEYFYFDGIMGLGRKYSNTKYSVLHTLKSIGKISTTKFSIKYDYNSNQAYLYVDEIHSDFKSTGSSIATCPLINSDYYGKSIWVCNIVSLGIKQGDNQIKKLVFNIEGIFDTGTNNVVFPSKYMEGMVSPLNKLNCYIYEEGTNADGSMKAIYCRNPDDLPKITIGLPQYILTLGKRSNFYNKIYVNNEYVYRLRFLFIEGIDFCIIGQNFFYEYHALFDDDIGVMKFYDMDSEVVYHKEDVSTGTKTWIIVVIVIGSILIVAGITTIIIIYCYCWRKPQPNVVLNKELLEMSSIKKVENEEEDDDDNEEKTFNQIMSITSDKRYRGIKINVNTNPKK